MFRKEDLAVSLSNESRPSIKALASRNNDNESTGDDDDSPWKNGGSFEVTDHTIESGAPIGDALGGSAGGDDATDGELVVVRGEVRRPDDATVARGGGRGMGS